jgi:hypothetical protein
MFQILRSLSAARAVHSDDYELRQGQKESSGVKAGPAKARGQGLFLKSPEPFCEQLLEVRGWFKS